MIRILSVTIRNFLSIGNITQAINLSLYGLTLILGENADVEANTNARNGVGKTSLLQAICYVLFGQPLTKIKLDNLVNNINNKGMLVTIEFEADGKRYRIERGRKPNVLKFFIDGKEVGKPDPTNNAEGENKHTQTEINRIIGMTHLMFKHVVALNTYTSPFLQLKAEEQRAVIEELLGITQLSQRAAALKDLSDLTKDDLKDEEAKIKANCEANARIEKAIEQAKAEAEAWRAAHDRQVNVLIARAETMSAIDVDAEIAVFDLIDAWTAQRKEIDVYLEQAQHDYDNASVEIARLQKELKRYEDEAARVDSGEIARLEAQMRRYIAESEQDIAVQLARLTAEATRRRKEAETKMSRAEQLAVDLMALQDQINNPNAHICTTCGQGLVGTSHLAKVMHRLEAQVQDLTGQIEKAMIEADASTIEADVIDVDIIQAKESHTAKQEEARSKAKAIRQDIEIARTVLEQQKQLAGDRVIELRTMLGTVTETHNASKTVLREATDAYGSIGPKPSSKYATRDAVWKIRQERDLLLNQIEAEITKPNAAFAKVEGLESTLIIIDYDLVNDLNLRLKHEVFLYKLLTAKDSFIRKKIVDQNLLYLNNRMNYYLERLYLPHEVRFLPDLTVDITLLGRDLDFEQLSRGESNRVVLATWLAFRDVWESLNTSFNLIFCDEVLDFGMDGHGAEAGLSILQSMARDRHKNVFLISHKENLVGQADRVMLVRKEDQFTNFTEDYQLA